MNTEITDFAQYFNNVHARTQSVIMKIPVDNVDWTYKEGKFTLGDMVRHITLIKRNMFMNIAQFKTSTYVGCGSEYGKSFTQIVDLSERQHSESMAIIQSFDQDHFNKKCITPSGIQMTVRKWLRAMNEHEIHHRGQLYIYLAMLNIEVSPVFGMTSEELIDKAKNAII
jgi:uncharacterized damage-inducible protein DinB